MPFCVTAFGALDSSGEVEYLDAHASPPLSFFKVWPKALNGTKNKKAHMKYFDEILDEYDFFSITPQEMVCEVCAFGNHMNCLDF